MTTAVASGELTKKITVDVKGEILELKNTINTMVDQLNSFASEVTRVAREVGTEGKLGGQAQVNGVAGVWKDLTDNVNSMAGNLTAQVRNIAEVTTAVANGDLSKKITVDVSGEILELKDTINTMVDQLNSFASEVTRVAREVGTEGKLGGQADVKGVAGTWKDLTDNVNSMAGNLTAQVRNIADVTTAVARGELNKKITVDVQGEILELKNTINTMVDQLNSFASEVTRVAREVGTEGKLGGQAQVDGVAGMWKDLTDNVNWMANNLTSQVRGIAKVVTAVANGDLKQKLRVEAKGEIATLADTINSMIDTLATFADQVTNVAREVGVEGKLGGQARVPGAAGTWRDLTENVNQLAANLTTQVRAIADVATAVTKGDLTRSIAVEAQGEVAELKDNINEMIRNLRDSTRKNMEQDWLKTNLAKFSRMLQGQRDLAAVSQLILSDLAPLVTAHHGVFYVVDSAGDTPALKLLASYAYKDRKHVASDFKMGEGLVGQVAKDRRMLTVGQVPHDYIQVSSGLGEAPPRSLVVLPVLFEGETKAVLELATFDEFDEIRLTFLEQLAESIGIVLNTIAANMRTEELLKQSQALTESLQSQQEALTETNKRLEQQTRSLQQSEELLRKQQDELQSTNAELEIKAQLLAGQKAEVEQKNKEVEQAKVALEEKAEQLALISKYKSEFLANMSHELRTPLNSLLILSQILSENAEGNLTAKQVGFAQTIHGSGSDLLDLINDILDLSKIESGTMAVDISAVPFGEVRKFVESTFRQMADLKGLHFEVEIDPALPPALQTDTKRLQQVLKNLLSNAFKFTERGSVSLNATLATGGWNPEQELLNAANAVVAFSVSDTGIGIPKEKHGVIFEAFQQGDTGTSRKYGGTGLGLSISRQITRLLGGEIRIESTPGAGSTFTLYLPVLYPVVPAADPTVQAEGQPELGHGLELGQGRHHGELARDAGAGGRAGHQRRPELHRGGRPYPPHRGGRSQLRPDPARSGARPGIQGHRGATRRSGARARPRVPAHGRHARSAAAGRGRLDHPRSAQARPGDPAHPGPHHLGRRELAARSPARRDRLPHQAGHQGVAERGAHHAARVHRPADQAAPGGGGRRGRPAEHRRAHRQRGRADDDRRQRRSGAAGPPERPLRLHGARPRPAGHDRVPAHHAGQERDRTPQAADDRLYREAAHQAGGGRAGPAGRIGGHQGRQLARAAAGRDRALPAPGDREPAGREAPDARGAPPERSDPHRPHRAHRRRRRPQHLRADDLPRAERDERGVRGERPRGHRAAAGDAGGGRGAHGRDDAGDGRLRDHARDPRDGAVPAPADHRRHGEGDEGRPREVHRGRRLGLHREAGRHGAAAVPAPRLAVPVTIRRAGSQAVGRPDDQAVGEPEARPAMEAGDAMDLIARQVTAAGASSVDAPTARPPDHPSDVVNILLVDDQPANLIALEAMLQGLGQNLIKASSGREALKWLLTHEVAVVLLDVKMPEMDGFETATLIRQRDKSRHTPIIFLTAADQSQAQAVRGYAVGAVDYLVKPVVPEFVRSKVAVFVELAKKNELLRRQTELLQAGEQEARELAEARAELVRDLEHKNRELESFSYAVSHDLRAPLRRIESFSRAVQDSQAERLDDDGRRYLDRVREASQQMSQLIDDVLYLARVTRAEMREQEVDLSGLVALLLDRMREADPGREAEVKVRPGVTVVADGQLLRIAVENLLENAWKFTAKTPMPRIEFGLTNVAGEPSYFVRDNGAGFDMAYADRLFGPFQRLHLASEFPGTGIGLATVQRIIHRHGGRVWAEGLPGQGATFHFTIGRVRG